MWRCSSAIARAVVDFLNSVLMGCFLACFRSRADASARREPLVPKTRLGEVFLDYEKGSGRLQDDLGNCGAVDEELRREANYLKFCGAISETPAEILKVSSRIDMENTNKCDNISTTVPSIQDTLVFEENSSKGFKCDEHDILRPELNIKDTKHVQGVESVPQPATQDKSPFQNFRNQLLDSSDSPFPTPLVLRDDMQTPATVCTAHRGTSRSGKRVRTRKQFIYSVLRPIENKFQVLEITDASSPMLLSNPPKRRNLGANSSNKPRQNSPSSIAAEPKSSKCVSFSFPNGYADQDKEVLSMEEFKSHNGSSLQLDGGELSKCNLDIDNEKHDVSSLSRWLKRTTADDENPDDVKSTVGKQVYDENGLFLERPVFAISNLNWDSENPTPMLPKVWDGNGIPNTTTKYKEDQNVSWHATPFEERLLKVLSDENLDSPRKLSRGKPIQLVEKAE